MSCSSSQPDEGLGDGNTTEDFFVAADGSSLQLRPERQGGAPAGRTYTVLATATAACRKESVPTPVGSVHVPHDQRD